MIHSFVPSIADPRVSHSRGAPRWAGWWPLFVVTIWLAGAPALPGMEEFCLLIEPKDGPQVKRMLKGGQMTALVPARETSIGGVRYYTEAEFGALGLGWRAFERKAEATATRVFDSLKPEVTKDAKGFVTRAVLRGKSHLTASAVLSPKFYESFRATMGDDLILLIPDRFTVYVFPRPMGEYKAMGPEILEAYAEATYPVSYEVLLLNKDGLSVLGSFRTE